MIDNWQRPSNWLHERRSFYKYTTRAGALAILNSHCLQWSSPISFNDPFDMQFNLKVKSDYSSVRQRTLDTLWEGYKLSKEIPVGNVFARFLNAFNECSPKLSREEFNRELGIALDESLPPRISEFNRNLRELLKTAKVLCLSETFNNFLMWSHYAESHQGLVIRLDCIPEHDSAWGLAQPMIYTDSVPQLLEDADLVGLYSGELSIIDPMFIRKAIDKLVRTKATRWEYEREWRLMLPLTDPAQPKQDIAFNPQDLSAVYFGIRMPDTEKEALTMQLRRDYQHAEIFEAVKMEEEFALRFRKY